MLARFLKTYAYNSGLVWMAFGLIWWWLTQNVIAQVRDDSEMVLAPALYVFSGQGSSEENFYLAVIVIAGGLLLATLFAMFAIGLQKASTAVLTKVFSVWLLFVLGASTLTVTRYMVTIRTYTPTQAEIEARPLDITYSRVGESLVLKWRTEVVAIGYVVANIPGEPDMVFVSNAGQKTVSHQVTISRLDLQVVKLAIFSNGREYRDEDGELLEIVVSLE
jgi:hypothetical protein